MYFLFVSGMFNQPGGEYPRLGISVPNYKKLRPLSFLLNVITYAKMYNSRVFQIYFPKATRAENELRNGNPAFLPRLVSWIAMCRH
jgi:hypothetical protein